jgi:hypothetical protein
MVKAGPEFRPGYFVKECAVRDRPIPPVTGAFRKHPNSLAEGKARVILLDAKPASYRRVSTR